MKFTFLKLYLFNLLNWLDNLKNIIITKYALAKKDLRFLSLKSVLFFFTFICFIFIFFILKIEIESKNTLIQFFSFPWFFVNLEKENRLQYFCKILTNIFKNEELVILRHIKTLKFFEDLLQQEDEEIKTKKLFYYFFLCLLFKTYIFWTFKIYINILEIILYNFSKEANNAKDTETLFLKIKNIIINIFKRFILFWQNFFIFLTNFFNFFNLWRITNLRYTLRTFIFFSLQDMANFITPFLNQEANTVLSLKFTYKFDIIYYDEEYIKENDIYFFFGLHTFFCLLISIFFFFFRWFLVLFFIKIFLPFIIFLFATASFGDFENIIWFPSFFSPESFLSKSIYETTFRSSHALLHTSNFSFTKMQIHKKWLPNQAYLQFGYHPTVLSNYHPFLLFGNDNMLRTADVMQNIHDNTSIYTPQALIITANLTHAEKTGSNTTNFKVLETTHLHPIPTLCQIDNLEVLKEDKFIDIKNKCLPIVQNLLKNQILNGNLNSFNYVITEKKTLIPQIILHNNLIRNYFIKNNKLLIPNDFFKLDENNNWVINESNYFFEMTSKRIFCRQTNKYIFAFPGYTLETPNRLEEEKQIQIDLNTYNNRTAFLYNPAFESFRKKNVPNFDIKKTNDDFVTAFSNRHKEFYLKNFSVYATMKEFKHLNINDEINNNSNDKQTLINLNTNEKISSETTINTTNLLSKNKSLENINNVTDDDILV